jgi:hypothetical protein
LEEVMKMNVRFGRNLVLLALVSAAAATTAQAAESSGPAFGTPRIPAASSADKAAEARRLAEQAAVLAKRAAQLAAESEAENASAMVRQANAWANRDAAEVLISDAEPQALPPITSAAQGTAGAVPTIGWRSHRSAPTSDVRFSDPSVPAATTAAAATKTHATPTATDEPAQSPATSPTDSFEFRLAEAAIAAQLDADSGKQFGLQEASSTPAHTATAALPTSPSIEPQLIDVDTLRVAKTNKIADDKVRTADIEEPIPAPESPYASDRPLRMGEGEPCECFDGACCPQPRPLFWTSGIEATFLRPDLNTGYAAFSAEEFSSSRYDYYSTSTNDVDDIYMSPRIWFGVQGCLWGANVRYWHLRANEGAFDPTLGSDGEWDGPNCGREDFGFNSCSALEAYTVDLEITRRFCLHDCWMQFSAGVRHAEIEHNAALNAQALADDSVLFGFANAHRQSRGTGFLLGWYGRKPIYPCSCVHWFYNFRWSALWGPTETAAETGVLVALTSTDPLAVAAAGSVNGASTVANDTLFIGEVQLGIEWDYALRCLPANAFCRVALEYQRWSSGTGYSEANSFAGVEINSVPTTLGDALAIADAPELDLVGLAVSTGLTW